MSALGAQDMVSDMARLWWREAPLRQTVYPTEAPSGPRSGKTRNTCHLPCPVLDSQRASGRGQGRRGCKPREVQAQHSSPRAPFQGRRPCWASTGILWAGVAHLVHQSPSSSALPILFYPRKVSQGLPMVPPAAGPGKTKAVRWPAQGSLGWPVTPSHTLSSLTLQAASHAKWPAQGPRELLTSFIL